MLGDPIIECVANVSEGRRREIIDTLATAIAAGSGVHLLHRTSDVHHNRSVFTFAGSPQPVLDAAYRLVELAITMIDLNVQRGVHPRMGAVDVVPFVPIRGISLEGCAALARQFGTGIAERFDLPVYCYEAAATRPERRNLADVRRGGYEGLKKTIHLPERQPDYGPARVGPAGAVIVGARPPLIAYNVYLNTDDVGIAKRIARAIRGSSGGLVGVKALGLLVGGRAQVSMNLTDYQRTPLYRVMEMIRREAAQYGVQVVESELIGLIPEDALFDVARWHLQLHDLEPLDILERRLRMVGATDE